jgi:hypothetical protein
MFMKQGQKKEPRPGCPGRGSQNPARTYFRAFRTIIGPKCLTAVFGMGTGVATWVWSPERHRRKDEGERMKDESIIVIRALDILLGYQKAAASFKSTLQEPSICRFGDRERSRGRGGPREAFARRQSDQGQSNAGCFDSSFTLPSLILRLLPCQKEVNAVKRSAVSTGRLRASLLVHLRPIDLVVFQEPVP